MSRWRQSKIYTRFKPVAQSSASEHR